MVHVRSIFSSLHHCSWQLVAIVYSLFAINANAHACPDIEQIVDVNCDRQLIIVAYGDSITFGTRDSERIGYPGRLKRMLPHAQIYNLGKPGEKSQGGRLRAHGTFAKLPNPDYVIIMEGTNDYWSSNPDAGSTVNNLLSIASTVRSTGGLPLIANLTPAYRFNQYSWITSVNRALVGKTDIDFFSLGSAVLSYDNLHPDAAGYQKMADLVANELLAKAAQIRPVDTDQDGVYDFEEDRYGTSKNSADSDSDGLSDSEEIYTYHTNPLATDTDSDGISDKEEVSLGSNPTDPRPTAPEITAIEVLKE